MGSKRWLLIAAYVVLWGCTSTDEDPGPITLAGPGEPIDEGFVVPQGAQLLVPPVPLVGGTYQGVEPDLAWAAHLYAEEPGIAFAGLARQAADMGFELRAPGAPCRFQLDADDRSSRHTMNCQADGWRTVDGKEEHLWVDVRRRPPSRWFGRPTGHATMQLDRWPEGSVLPRYFEIAGPIPEEVYDPAFDVDLRPPSLGPGYPLPTLSRADATIGQGSRPVAPVEGRLCEGGFRVALDVTGDPDEVFEGYAVQMRRWADEFGYEVDERESTLFGRDIREVHSPGGVDSTTYTATMVTGPGDEPVRLLYEFCGG